MTGCEKGILSSCDYACTGNDCSPGNEEVYEKQRYRCRLVCNPMHMEANAGMHPLCVETCFSVMDLTCPVGYAEYSRLAVELQALRQSDL